MNPLADIRMWRRVVYRVSGLVLLVCGTLVFTVAAISIWEQFSIARLPRETVFGITLVGWHITAFYGVVALFAICTIGLAVSFIFLPSDDA